MTAPGMDAANRLLHELENRAGCLFDKHPDCKCKECEAAYWIVPRLREYIAEDRYASQPSFTAGAEAMREAAAFYAETHWTNGDEDKGYVVNSAWCKQRCLEPLGKAIRALPLPAPAGDGRIEAMAPSVKSEIIKTIGEIKELLPQALDRQRIETMRECCRLVCENCDSGMPVEPTFSPSKVAFYWHPHRSLCRASSLHAAIARQPAFTGFGAQNS